MLIHGSDNVPLKNTIQDQLDNSTHEYNRQPPPIVDLVEDMMVARGKIVEYKLISTAGHPYNRQYTFNAKSGKTVVHGSGSSRIEAKNDAAKKLVLQLSREIRNETMTCTATVDRLLGSDIPVGTVDEKSKNYISTLQEVCLARRWTLPMYEFFQEKSNDNRNPIHCVKCSVGAYKSMGTGNTKRIAKNKAAFIIYDQIVSSQQIDTFNEKTKDFRHGLSKNEAKSDMFKVTNKLKILRITDDNIFERNSKDFISLLQELCMARDWMLPNYEFFQENVNKDHTLLHSVICSAGPYKSKGEGNTKRIAKHRAAQLTYNKINFQCGPPNQFTSNDNINLSKNFDKIDVINFVRLCSSQLKLSKNKYVKILKKCNVDEIKTNAFEFLTKLSKEEGFDNISRLVNINSTDVSIWMQVSTIPFLVCLGTGKTMEEAQNVAAHSALIYIKKSLLE